MAKKYKGFKGSGMREILFRGFHPDKNGKHKVFVNGEWIKGEWVNGYYSALKAPSTGEIKHVIFSFDRVVDYVIPETVGEYSGENDRNGKRMFEGDIVSKYSNNSGKRVVKLVVFELGMFFWKYSEDAGLPLCDVSDKCEVIGNIYETPELLEVENAKE